MEKQNSKDINLRKLKEDNLVIVDSEILLKHMNFKDESPIVIAYDSNMSNNNLVKRLLIVGQESLTFEKCDFKDFEVSNYTNTLYFKNCTFNNITLQHKFHNIIFQDCKVEDKFTIKNYLSSKDPKLSAGNNAIIISGGSIKEFDLVGLVNFEHRFVVDYSLDDRQAVTSLKIIDSIFEEDFSFYNGIIKNIEIKNCDFNSLSDFNNIIFQEGFDFQEITYKGFSLFDDCIFNEKVEFKYIIFEKFTSFRNSIFNKGINLDYTSSDKDVNFYGVKGLDSIISKQNTSQETYRIIKNQFEKLNNKIEANKYHALELDQRKTELEKDKWKNLSEYLVFKIHDLSSKHSTSYFRPILGIIFIGFFTIFLVHFDVEKDLFFHPSNFQFEYLIKIWSEFWQYINITNLEKLKDKSFILFLNKVSLGYLYYQFLTAVRKDTRK